jgi:hypothetical protein
MSSCHAKEEEGGAEEEEEDYNTPVTYVRWP